MPYKEEGEHWANQGPESEKKWNTESKSGQKDSPESTSAPWHRVTCHFSPYLPVSVIINYPSFKA